MNERKHRHAITQMSENGLFELDLASPTKKKTYIWTNESKGIQKNPR